jgi:hypothetical protein
VDRPRGHSHPALRPPRWPALPRGRPAGSVRGRTVTLAEPSRRSTTRTARIYRRRIRRCHDGW